MKIQGMEFTPKTTGNTKYMKPNELPTKDYFVGVYRGTMQSKYGINYKFLHKKDGEVVVNACGSLKQGMTDVPVGTTVALRYNGKEKLKKGNFAGKEFHNVEVLIGEMAKDSDKINEEEIPF